jgi:hypothetical protein
VPRFDLTVDQEVVVKEVWRHGIVIEARTEREARRRAEEIAAEVARTGDAITDDLPCVRASREVLLAGMPRYEAKPVV